MPQNIELLKNKSEGATSKEAGQRSIQRQNVRPQEIRTNEIRPQEEHLQEVTVRPQEGYFIRDLERDEVICPAGNILHRKCTKSNGYTRYMSKSSCSKCEQFRRCYSGKQKWKEIDFSKDARIVRCRNWTKEI